MAVGLSRSLSSGRTGTMSLMMGVRENRSKSNGETRRQCCLAPRHSDDSTCYQLKTDRGPGRLNIATANPGLLRHAARRSLVGASRRLPFCARPRTQTGERIATAPTSWLFFLWVIFGLLNCSSGGSAPP